MKEQIKINYDEIGIVNGLRAIYTEKEKNHELHQSLLKS